MGWWLEQRSVRPRVASDIRAERGSDVLLVQGVRESEVSPEMSDQLVWALAYTCSSCRQLPLELGPRPATALPQPISWTEHPRQQKETHHVAHPRTRNFLNICAMLCRKWEVMQQRSAVNTADCPAGRDAS